MGHGDHKWSDMAESGVAWGELWERQGKRLPLARRWYDALALPAGARVADVGCGPGRLALAYASWGASVLALDASPEAIAYLQARKGDADVEARVLDVEASPLPTAERVDAIMLTNVLHHVARPERVLANLRAARAPLLVAEFDTEGAGEVGPPLDERLPPARLLAWLREAGFEPGPVEKQDFEQYAVLAR